MLIIKRYYIVVFQIQQKHFLRNEIKSVEDGLYFCSSTAFCYSNKWQAPRLVVLSCYGLNEEHGEDPESQIILREKILLRINWDHRCEPGCKRICLEKDPEQLKKFIDSSHDESVAAVCAQMAPTCWWGIAQQPCFIDRQCLLLL